MPYENQPFRYCRNKNVNKFTSTYCALSKCIYLCPITSLLNIFTMTTQTDKTVATEILRQLGGNRFIAMTGSKYFTCYNNSLSFKVGARCLKGITHVKITLNSLDLYDVEFLRAWSNNPVKTIATHCDIYNDMLQSTFKAETGLNTRLF